MADRQEVRVPDIGDIDAVTVLEILVAVGDEVAVEDSLITLESDKASMDVPSPVAGTVREISVAVGDEVSEGSVILILEASAAASESKAEPEAEASAETETESQPEAPTESKAPPASTPTPAAPPAASPPAPKPQASASSSPPAPQTAAPQTATAANGEIDETAFRLAYASPSVRRLARQLGVDLGRVSGSGRKGRITQEDVHGFVKEALQQPAGGVGEGVSGFAWPAMPSIDFAKFGAVESKPLSRIRKVAARNLHRSWLHVPHVTQHDEADITDMEAFRKAEGETAKKEGYKLTPVAFLLKAAAAALKTFPDFNASLDESGENLILKHYVHIGVAVDTPQGLVVPVIRDVDRKSLSELAKELMETSSRARDGKLKPDDFQGGCFTISSLGGIGGTAFTPIVNAPEVAILGVSRSQLKPVWNGSEFEPRLMLPLSLSYDHRVIDGASAARFVVHLGGLLSDLRRLLL